MARSERLKAIEGIAAACNDSKALGAKLCLVSCGPLTNLALFVSVYPELLPVIEEICFMGGGALSYIYPSRQSLLILDDPGVGIGNRSAVSGSPCGYVSDNCTHASACRMEYSLRPRSRCNFIRRPRSQGEPGSVISKTKKHS